MSIDMEQFHKVFFEESQEHLEEMERLLMSLDLDCPDAEELNCIFRAAHSIKGGSGIFGFDALTGLTHIMENLLDRARNNTIEMTVPIVDSLLNTVDVLKDTLERYRTDTAIDDVIIESEIKVLEALLDEGALAPTSDDSLSDDGFGFFEPLPNDPNGEEDEGFGLFADDEEEDDDSFGFFDDEPAAESPPGKENPNAEPVIKPAGSKINREPAPAKSPVAKTVKSGDSGSIRVDTSKIDALVNLVGELVITQSMLALIGDNKEQRSEDKLQTSIAELERNTREIQEAVMSIRMLPISFIFNRFPRLVRDLSSKLGKKLDLNIEGGSTEVDKGLIEKLVDPLTHLVRNSIDHGVEMPEKRIAAGKKEVGTVTLSATQRGGSIVISISDDGNGLNKAKILEKAHEKGIAVSDRISDQGIYELIFAPGFSTAEAVTDVSGRGVGMDVVKRNIESIGGRIEIESAQGTGSTFQIILPLTLAIVDGMCVGVGDQIYVVPLVNIVESIQPSKEQVKLLSNDMLLWVRDEYWPIIELGQSMQIDAERDPTKAIVVLIESSKKRFGLLVDGLVGQQQVVIKSLEQNYKRVAGVAGATIMGDGKVALILDVESLSKNVSDPIMERVANGE